MFIKLMQIKFGDELFSKIKGIQMKNVNKDQSQVEIVSNQLKL